ncbi:hypothetical protein SNOUR_07900 [Streptomyces noursei ATCC 11455]|nr:hypothetical protein SNOUR_07900 [Streptomyces noursei ATCC 11455]
MRHRWASADAIPRNRPHHSFPGNTCPGWPFPLVRRRPSRRQCRHRSRNRRAVTLPPTVRHDDSSAAVTSCRHPEAHLGRTPARRPTTLKPRSSSHTGSWRLATACAATGGLRSAHGDHRRVRARPTYEHDRHPTRRGRGPGPTSARSARRPRRAFLPRPTDLLRQGHLRHGDILLAALGTPRFTVVPPGVRRPGLRQLRQRDGRRDLSQAHRTARRPPDEGLAQLVCGTQPSLRALLMSPHSARGSAR